MSSLRGIGSEERIEPDKLASGAEFSASNAAR